MFIFAIGLVTNFVPFVGGVVVEEETRCTELLGDPPEESDMLKIAELLRELTPFCLVIDRLIGSGNDSFCLIFGFDE